MNGEGYSDGGFVKNTGGDGGLFTIKGSESPLVIPHEKLREDIQDYMQMYDQLVLKQYQAGVMELAAKQEYLMQRGLIKRPSVITKRMRKDGVKVERG